MKKSQLKGRMVDTQPQLTRLHGMVQRIQRGDYPSAKTLGREWNKHPITILRNLDFIRDVWKLPLAYDPYKYGFYFTEPIGNFPMVQISQRELVSVFLAQKMLPQYRGTPFEKPLQSAFSKLISSMEGELSVAWSDLDAAISFRGIQSEPGDLELMQQLAEAIRTRHEVQFEYVKLGAQAGEVRRLRPYHLANVANQWYLFGYDYLREDIRKFVPARMKSLEVLREQFERPKDFSIDKVLKGSFGVFSGGDPIPIRIWFDRERAQLMRERKWHHSQKIKELRNGEIELRLELSSFIEIVPWILSWGRHAKVISPKELVAEVREEARQVGAQYKNS
jgi:predicted DNA-binding transcriptional regulator YafY